MWELVRVIYHPVKFSGQGHSGSRDKMVFVCHVTFQNDVIKALYGFRLWSPSRLVTTLPSLVAINTVVVEI